MLPTTAPTRWPSSTPLFPIALWLMSCACDPTGASTSGQAAVATSTGEWRERSDEQLLQKACEAPILLEMKESLRFRWCRSLTPLLSMRPTTVDRRGGRGGANRDAATIARWRRQEEDEAEKDLAGEAAGGGGCEGRGFGCCPGFEEGETADCSGHGSGFCAAKGLSWRGRVNFL